MTPNGNTILITGGASGIGRALAERFHAAGNKVIIAGRRQSLLDEVVAANPGAVAYRLDVGDPEAIRAFATKVVAEHPELNVLVNNAGVMVAENLKGDDFLGVAEQTISVNLLGPIRLTAALLPHLRGKPGATIVNVSSGLAFVPMPMTPTYCATKAALHSYSISLRAQLRGSGIEVLELVPPGVQTDLMPGQADSAHLMPLKDFIDEVMGIFAQQPTPSEIAVERVLFLRNAEREGRFDAALAAIAGARD